MYERRGRLNNRQQTELITFFVAGATARAAGEMAGVNRNTAASCFMRLRRLIASHLPGYRLSGEIEADESCFGGIRKGKRGRGSAGKTAGSGLLKRNGKVCMAINPNACAATLTPIIEGRVEPDSIAHTDTFKAYNALGVSGFHHHRPNHSRLSAEQADHIILESGEKAFAAFQRHQARTFLLVPEETRMALQCRQSS